MGQRGPLKLPNHLQAVPAGDDITTAADTVRPVMPEKPDHLDDGSRLSELWDEIGGALDENGMIARCDGPVLEIALRHYIVASTASADLFEEPRVWDEKNGRWAKNPSSQVFRDHSTAFLEYAKQLGMTFVARARTPVKGDSDGGDSNPFAAPGG